MRAALALAARERGNTRPNPNVGCVIVRDGRLIGRGFTQPGGRPHAEAMALAGCDAAGATVYVTLEPCAHRSPRGPACADLLAAARPARVVVAMTDPDPRTAGEGVARLRAAGIAVTEGVCAAEARRELAGFAGRLAGRPELTLKLAMSLDGRLAMASGESQWITGPLARAMGHRLRADSALVAAGGGTFRADHPRLDARLPGYAGAQPLRAILTTADVPPPFLRFASVANMDAYAAAHGLDRILVEGGPRLAAGLLAQGRADRLAIFRAPILLGGGPGLEGFAPPSLAAAHGQWTLLERRQLGPDLYELFELAPQLRARAMEAFSSAPATSEKPIT